MFHINKEMKKQKAINEYNEWFLTRGDHDWDQYPSPNMLISL